MKTIIPLLLSICLISSCLSSYSQSSLKIGHVNINEILAALPEKDSAQVKIDRETKEIEKSYEEMKVVYNNIVNDYQQGLKTFSDLVKKAKEDEILDKQKRLQEFEQNANVTLQQRNIELFQPIYNKVIKAIEKVANEKGFTYILDLSKESVVFASKDSQNLNQQVISILKQ
jgi:outer membrane protein